MVASSAAAQDFYHKVLRKESEFTEAVRLRVSRTATLLVGAIGLVIAVSAQNLVYTLVSYSATGLFSAFGPAFALLFFWRDRLSKAGVVAAFIAGPAATLLWISFGMTSIVTVRLVAPPIGFVAAIAGSLLWPRTRTTQATTTDTPTTQD